MQALERALTSAGHAVESIILPFAPEADRIVTQLAAYRWIDVTRSADRLVCLDAPAHVVRHPRKVVWAVTRVETWPGVQTDVPAEGASAHGVANAVGAIDAEALREARRVLATSNAACGLLARYAGLAPELLRIPAACGGEATAPARRDVVVNTSPIEPESRLELLVDALARTESDVRLRLCGRVGSESYAASLEARIDRQRIRHRIVRDDEVPSEDEEIRMLREALALVHVPAGAVFQDPFASTALSCSTPVVTTTDSGALLELVTDEETGVVATPTAASLAAAMDRLRLDPAGTERMGRAARECVGTTVPGWAAVIERLLS